MFIYQSIITMKQLQKIPESIIHVSFKIAVWLIERFSNMASFHEKVARLRQLEKGTLGREIADCLDQHQLTLVPGYESHDLKHSLLGYQMTPVDEIRLQAFMLGNGNVSLPSIAIFLFGFLLLPHHWKQFFNDFRTGYQSSPIKNWTIEDYAHKDLLALRASVIMASRKQYSLDGIMKKMAYACSILAMGTGAFGMMYCLPFLYSNLLEDLVGAGFPFVGGAILFIGGLISLSIQSKKAMATSVGQLSH